MLLTKEDYNKIGDNIKNMEIFLDYCQHSNMLDLSCLDNIPIIKGLANGSNFSTNNIDDAYTIFLNSYLDVVGLHTVK